MRRTVAFIDVLGFKKMIESESAEDLGKKYQRVINYALEKNSIEFDVSKEATFFPGMKNSDEYCISYVFSDSIILASYDDSEINCLKLLIFAFKLTRTMIAQGFLVRGGITFGDMFIDLGNSVFVGSALTQAYELESKQDWAGITIHDNIPEKFPNIFNGTLTHGGYLNCIFVKYNVPMKHGDIKDLYTINWRWNLVVEKGTQSLLGNPTEWSAKNKVDNTLKYAKFIRENKLTYPADGNACPIQIRSMFVAKGPPSKVMPTHGDEY